MDEARSKMIKEALPESPSPGEKLDYHETDLFKKLQSMRDQQTVDDEAASLERSKATENEDDDVEDDDEEGDEGEDDVGRRIPVHWRDSAQRSRGPGHI